MGHTKQLRTLHGGYSTTKERFQAEGEPYSLSSAYFDIGSNALGAYPISNLDIGAVSTTAGFNRTFDKAFFVESITLQCSHACLFRIQNNANIYIAGYTSQAAPHYGSTDIQFATVAGYVECTVAVGQFIRQFDGEFKLITKGVLGASGTTAGVNVVFRLNGYLVTDDLNFSADKTILLIGDSRFNGTGPTSKLKNFQWSMLRYFRDTLGVNCRYVNRSLSGACTTDHEQLRQMGRYDELANVDLIYYGVGVNDAGYSVSIGTTNTNLDALIAWKKKFWPNAILVIEGPTPLQVNGSETNAAAIRSSMSSKVAAASDAKIKYFNAGTAFDRTVNSYYASSDPTGQGVHLSDTGHAAWYAAWKTWYEAATWTF